MIQGALRLLSRFGLQATSLSEVLALTGAPRGSIYHHFPDGKDELVASAVDLAGDQLLALLDRKAGAPALQVAEAFLDIGRAMLTRSTFTEGCAVLAVTVGTDAPDLIAHVARIFRAWRARLAQLLEQGGLTSADAAALSATLIAGSEGAIVLSRAEQSIEPYDFVARQLLAQVERAAKRT